MSASQPLHDEIAVSKSGLKTLYIIGGIAAVLQLVTILSYGVIVAILGPKPTSAEEYFAIHQTSHRVCCAAIYYS